MILCIVFFAAIIAMPLVVFAHAPWFPAWAIGVAVMCSFFAWIDQRAYRRSRSNRRA